MTKNDGSVARLWEAYREVVTSPEAVASFATLVLAAGSWATSAAFGADPTGTVVATVLGWAGALAGGIVIARGAITGLLRREVNVDELVTIAIVASLLAGEYLGAALVAFMMLFGKVLEDATAARAADAIKGLGRLLPDVARVRRGGAEVVVPVDDLVPGDDVVIRPGERIPADGTVASGRAWVDEAAITGESAPASRGPGDPAYAGTLATGGALVVTVARTGESTALGRIGALVSGATAERAPVVRVADRWATWFTPAILVLGGATWAATGDSNQAVAVLVVACPCALTLATPTAIVATVARAARAGILVRGGARVEAAGMIDVACLDKTGTLTTGAPTVVDVIPLGGHAPGEVLRLAAVVEARSEHPLGRAIVGAAQAAGTHVDLPVAGFLAEAGRGVVADVTDGTATRRVAVGRPGYVRDLVDTWDDAATTAIASVEASGRTPVAVAIDGTVAGIVALADVPRPGTAAAITALRRAGVRRIVLLTGDAAGPAIAVANAAGIAVADVHHGLLPEGKVDIIRALQADGHRVAMVGDGVNDAPALAAANLGVAMGVAGTDLAMAAADVVLLGDDLEQVARVIGMGREAMATIRHNLWIAAGWNLVALAAAATGVAGIVAGALVHNLGSVGVVANAARLVGRPAPGGRGAVSG